MGMFSFESCSVHRYKSKPTSPHFTYAVS